jgi:hypothetical protein
MIFREAASRLQRRSSSPLGSRTYVGGLTKGEGSHTCECALRSGHQIIHTVLARHNSEELWEWESDGAWAKSWA